MFDLDGPRRIVSAGLSATSDGSVLDLRLAAVAAPPFAASAAPATDPQLPAPVPPSRFLVAIDPGHGGVDPGAIRNGIAEKDIALAFGQEIAALFEANDAYDVMLTRSSDRFLSLTDRVRRAREQEADIFISIHANTVTEGDARGAAVYTLSDEATDAASAALAELENRADVAGGLDIRTEVDAVAKVLVDMAMTETRARSHAIAETLVAALRDRVSVLRTQPHRSAGFRVLKAPDIPSVLLELGFLSNARDRANMQDPVWRQKAGEAVLAAIEVWRRRELDARVIAQN